MMALWFAGLLASVILDGGVQGTHRVLLMSHPNHVQVETENGSSWFFALPEGRPTHLALTPGRVWVLDAARRVVEGYDLQGGLQVRYALPEDLGPIRELTVWMNHPVVLDAQGTLAIVDRPAWTERLALPGLVHPTDLQFVNGEWWVLDRAPSGLLGYRMWLRVYDLHGRLLRSVRLPAELTLGVDLQVDPLTGTLRVLDAAQPRIWKVDPQTGTLLGADTLLSGGNIALLDTWNGALWVITLGTTSGVDPVQGIGVAAGQEPAAPHTPTASLQLSVQMRTLHLRAPGGTADVLDALGRRVARVTFSGASSRTLRLHTGFYWVVWTSPEGTALRKRVVIP